MIIIHNSFGETKTCETVHHARRMIRELKETGEWHDAGPFSIYDVKPLEVYLDNDEIPE